MPNDGFPAGNDNRRRGNAGTDPKRVSNTLDLMPKVAALRATGASYREIGATLGIDWSWARTLVLRALEEATFEAADLMRTQEGIRLDRLQSAVWRQATSGDVGAVNAVLRIMDRRAKLFGLDAPTQVNVEVPEVDDIDAALNQILGRVTTPTTE